MTISDGASILVLCTGNSARSQMAAAFLEQYLGDRFAIFSAGTEPVAAIHPLAIEAMRAKGFELTGQPKDAREFFESLSPRYAITVCDGAAETCPVWPGPTERLHWPFEDPAAAEGSDEERLTKFREVRDQIEEKIRSWSAELPSVDART